MYNSSTATTDCTRSAYRGAVVECEVFVGSVFFVLYTVLSTQIQHNQGRSYSHETYLKIPRFPLTSCSRAYSKPKSGHRERRGSKRDRQIETFTGTHRLSPPSTSPSAASSQEPRPSSPSTSPAYPYAGCAIQLSDWKIARYDTCRSPCRCSALPRKAGKNPCPWRP